MANHLRTYRHEKTGIVGLYHPNVALAHPHLIEVPEGTKPFALMPIPHEAVVSRRAAQKEKSPEGLLLDDKDEE